MVVTFAGCDKTHDAELAQARAESDAAKAEASELRTKLSRASAERDAVQARADSLASFKKEAEDAKAEVARLKAQATALRSDTSPDPKPAGPKVAGAKALDGTWDVVSDADPTFSFAGATVQIVTDEKEQGDMLVRLPSRDGVTPGMTFVFVINKVDAGREPHAIILVSTLDAKDRHGIYQLDGGTLKLSVAPPGKPAPTDYKYEKDKTYKVMVLRRQAK